jgi:hypothetical protein
MLAVASGTISLTLTASHLTKPLRHHWLDAPFMLGELINCPYCMAHWTSMLLVILSPAPSILSWLVVTGLSAIFIGVVQRLLLFRESENEDLRELLREARETINDLVEKDNA